MGKTTRKLEVDSPVPTDIDIANSVEPLHISEIAQELSLSPKHYDLYGNYKAKLLSNGMVKNAGHQAVVNSNCSRLSIVTFHNPAQEAKVYPLKVREGKKPILDEPITFAEMYRRKKMSKDLELARLKKLAKEQNMLKTQHLETKPIDEILA